MNKIDRLYNEYYELQEQYNDDKSLNLKEELKNKLIELDYEINKDYEIQLDNNFPMTTTLEKEKNRLEKLISFVESKSKEQNKLINEYKKSTGDVIELSYLKYSDNLKQYRYRLTNVKKILSIIDEIKETKNESKVKVIKNKLLRKDLLNLLYEFCLIDNLDTKEIDVNKLIQNNENNEIITKQALLIKEEQQPIEIPEKEETVEELPKKIEIEEIKEEEILETQEENKEDDEKILTSMPIVDKIGSVVPVNVFESLQKTEEKLPDVVLPSNGLKDDQNDIFLETKDLFEESEKQEEKNLKK